jgi:hypothetical protein
MILGTQYGSYLEAGPIRRIFPRLRVGATVGTEWWWGNSDGLGLRIGTTIEYTGANTHGTSVEHFGYDAHTRSTDYSARAGSFAIGMFVDAGHRWLRNEPNNTYVTFGLSFRLAAMVGLVDASRQH